MPHIQQLIDRQAIADVLHGYCRALDTMRLHELRAIFTEDCVVEFGPDPRLNSTGRPALEASLARLWRWQRTSHHLSNLCVSFGEPGRAAAESYVIAWHERPDGSSATLWGQYHDQLVDTPEGWRIARRRQVMSGSDPSFTVQIHRLARESPPPGWTAPALDAPPTESVRGAHGHRA